MLRSRARKRSRVASQRCHGAVFLKYWNYFFSLWRLEPDLGRGGDCFDCRVVLDAPVVSRADAHDVAVVLGVDKERRGVDAVEGRGGVDLLVFVGVECDIHGHTQKNAWAQFRHEPKNPVMCSACFGIRVTTAAAHCRARRPYKYANSVSMRATRAARRPLE